MGEQYERHQGGEKSRALGTAVHLLLEHLAASPSPHGRGDAEPSLRKILPRIQARLRASGWDSEQAASLAAEALAVAAQTSRDKDARWILSPHFQAQSEVRWTGVFDGRVREVRLDRIFKAGPEPHAPGDQCWWIIDYKTAVADAFGPLAVVAMRPRFAPQLEHYARVLRKLHGTDAPIRAGLYYPRIPALDWWVL